jgi:hypothetical protein
MTDTATYDAKWLAIGIAIGLFFGVPQEKVIGGLALGVCISYMMAHTIGYRHYLK